MGLSCKEAKTKEYYLSHPEEGLKPVTALPVEWALEGISDVADTLTQMVETGPTLALAATLAVNLIPGKIADKVLEPAVKKLDNAANATKSTITQSLKKVTRRMDQYNVPCFTPGDSVLKSKSFSGNKPKMEKQYYQQIKNQEDGINNLTVGEYLENRNNYIKLGRHGVSDGKAQKAAGNKLRKKLTEKFKEELLESNTATGKVATELAKERAKKTMESLAALHDLDMIAGGNDRIPITKNRSGMGNTNINSSLGSQWKNRVDDMDDAAEDAMKKYGPNVKMNVPLTRCKV